MEGDRASSSTPPPGRVVRIHLACRAALPIGTSLRVTGALLRDPSEGTSGCGTNQPSSDGRDPFGRLKPTPDSDGDTDGVTETMKEVAIDPEGGKDGPRARSEWLQSLLSCGGCGIPGEDEGADRILMGVRDGTRSDWSASTVEMVTCPDTYPIWRTRLPVVLAVTDPPGAADAAEGNGEATPSAGAFRHYYRYLAVTPGAENDGPYGMSRSDSVADADSIGAMLNKTKISSGSLANLGNAGRNPSYGGASFPVCLWEDPFLDERGAAGAARPSSLPSREFSFLSARSAEASVRTRGGGGDEAGVPLAGLPYRAVDVDAASGATGGPPGGRGDSARPEYTGDGVLVDNWNGTGDVTYRPYRVREGLGARGERGDSDKSLASSGGDTSAATDEDEPRPRVFVICYHLPVIVTRDPDTGEWRASWSESLLAKTKDTGELDNSSCDPHWVGTVTTPSPPVDDADREALRALLASMDCTALFFDECVRDAHYKGFCKQVLWLAFHHVDLLDMRDPAFSMDLDATSGEEKKADAEGGQSGGTLLDLRSMWDQRQVDGWYEAYNLVNRTFAQEVAKMARPGDVAWVHDYHLSLLPRMLAEEERKLGTPPSRATKKIFFLHIPFPVSMVFREVECGPDVLEGMLHADVVGFHGFTEARHFLSCAKRILGLPNESLEGGLIGVKYRGRTVVVTMSSVSIEPYVVDAAMRLPTTIDGEAALRAKHAGRTIIAGLDVAQYLSGVAFKLSTYEQLLEDAPTWRDSLVLVQRCLIPGTRRLDEARTVREIRRIVGRIKSKYGDAVIDYAEAYGSALPKDQRLALWRASDCLLCTEVRCGLNTLPLEYVYAQKGSANPGVVVASEFSAVFGILNGAMRISPFAIRDTAATIDEALTMEPADRERRHLRDIDFVSSSPSAKWSGNVLRDLWDRPDDDRGDEGPDQEQLGVAEFLASERDCQFTRLDPKSIMSAYKSTSRRVIILDFNGTIVMKEAVDSFLKRDAIGSAGDAPPEAVCRSLEKLCADPQNTVFVVSGDNSANVEKAIGNIPGLGLAASNGSCFSPAPENGDTARNWLALDLGVDWASVKKVAIAIMSKFTARTNGSFIKLAHSSVGWSYYSCDPEFGSIQATYLMMELERDLAAYDVRFVNLKGIVEVIPRRLDKGIVVKKILRDVAARDGAAGVDFVLCMGDDISDEKMFTSVFSFISEMDDDYANVTPSPQVTQLVKSTLLPASRSFLREAPCVRCGDPNAAIFAFTVAVGKKPTHASQFVDGAEDVADLLVKMATGSADAFFGREKEGERQLKRFSQITGSTIR